MNNNLKKIVMLFSIVFLNACGGGSPNSPSSAVIAPPGTVVTPPVVTPPLVTPPVVTPPLVTPPLVTPPVVVPPIVLNLKQSSRFLQKVTFGAKYDEIVALTNTTPQAWVDDQIAKPMTSMQQKAETFIAGLPIGQAPGGGIVFDSFYTTVLTADDQLRQRVAFALSQLFVVSIVDENVRRNPRGVASYYDMLAKNAFGNYRDIIQSVSLHPIMGYYLTSLGNKKADNSGRKPDENYAREVMQLFSIGLYKLNIDGTVVKDSNGNPIETYNNNDITGLAKVFTGWSYAGPDTQDNRFYDTAPPALDVDRMIKPMQLYAPYHSPEAKTVLGVTIPANGDGNQDLKIAMDTLFNHPNVGPFISKQLIQRLITSNPSPQYVARVATVFNDNGSGVRGDMKAVIKAIVLDSEALNDNNLNLQSWGKIKEPVIRVTNLVRTFKGFSFNGKYGIGLSDDAVHGINQSPLFSPSVFNFYRPGYVPPGTKISLNGLVAPEMQITHEASVVGYSNYISEAVVNGIGYNAQKDISFTYADEVLVANDPTVLVNRISLLLTADRISDIRKNKVITAVSTITVPVANGSNNALIQNALLNRVKLALLMIMNMQEYIVQK